MQNSAYLIIWLARLHCLYVFLLLAKSEHCTKCLYCTCNIIVAPGGLLL